VFFFLIESKDRSLEEIDAMYVLEVNPITSKKWDGSQMNEESEKEVRTNSDATERRESVLEVRARSFA
jgi:SP family sugar:H+ symporter-like MFS transporter